MLTGWTGYRLCRNYQDAGRFTTVNVASTLVSLCIGLIIVIAVFRYANRPEAGDKI